MRFQIFIFSSLCLFFGAVNSSATEIRVRLMSSQTSIEIQAKNFQIFTAGQRCSNPKVKINSQETEMIVRYQAQHWHLQNLHNRQDCELSGSILKLRATELVLNHKSSPPDLNLIASKNLFEVIAVMDVEKYLVGVLSKEMPASFPLEAFKAQAIASRSYALKTILSSHQKTLDIESSIADQVYDFNPGTEKIRSAVSETRNIVLENGQGRLFPVYYHADCGGHTEEASEVWGTAEKIGTTSDEACPLESHSSWSYNISRFELSARLRVILQLADAQIVSIQEFENSSSGRKKSLRFVLDDQSTRIISGQQLRNILGYDKLKSTLFAFNSRGADFVFEGRGLGHGVGMCQWGARHLALTGESYPAILKHYFHEARLVKLSSPARLAMSL